MDVKYSIKDIENLTGIKAHTIRIWEQRYNLLSPERTDTNIRYYLDSDLKKILNVNLLYKNGTKISKIAKLNEQEILEGAKSIIEKDKNIGNEKIDQFIQVIIDLETDKIQQLLDDTFKSIGIINMYQEVIIPLLVRIGELWQLGTMNVAHEHFFSHNLREFIMSKINALPPGKKGKKVLLFLHEQEEHELPLLFYNYLLKDKGWDCIYLGQKVPFTDLENTYYQVSPDMVLTSMITNISSKKFKHILNQTLDIVPNNQLCLSGHNTILYKTLIPENVNVINRLHDFSEIFSN